MSKPNTDSDLLTDRQELYLQRQWTLIDGVKKLRGQLPLAICTALLGISGFFIGNRNLPSTEFERRAIASAVIAITILGLFFFRVIQLQYQYFYKKIWDMYEILNMTGSGFGESQPDSAEQARDIFLWSYIGVSVIGVLSLSAILLKEKPVVKIKQSTPIYAIDTCDLASLNRLDNGLGRQMTFL